MSQDEKTSDKEGAEDLSVAAPKQPSAPEPESIDRESAPAVAPELVAPIDAAPADMNGGGTETIVDTVHVTAPAISGLDMEDDEDDDEVETVSEENLEFVSDDPLAPAYDLDRGAPLNKQEATTPGRAPWRTEVRSAKEFFNTEILYRFDIIEPPERVPMEGRYRIELRGANGGVWTITLGEDLEVVNRKEDADTVLVLQHRDFLEIVNGTLNPQLAILAQKVKVQGNVKKAILLQNILAPLPE